MKRALAKGKRYRIEGPAYVRLIEGEILALGKILKPRESIVVPKAKAMTIEVTQDSIVEVRLGEGATMVEDKEEYIPPEWKEITEKILSLTRPIKVIVLGEVDSGKSTFTVFLANSATSKKLRTYVVDADVGQSDIGVPTTIGLGYVRRPITTLSQVPMVDGYFVGTVSPAPVMHRVLVGTSILVHKAIEDYKADVVIVNTSGWVSDNKARELKWNMILLIRPQIVVVLERTNELEPIIQCLKGLKWLEVIRAPALPRPRIRSREERKMLREASYKRYLSSAKVRTFNLRKIGFMGAIFSNGIPLSKEKIYELQSTLGVNVVHAEETPDRLLVVLEKPIRGSIAIARELSEKIGKKVNIIYEGFERGLLVGIWDKNGRFLGIGMISEIDYKNRQIRVLTNVEEEEVGMIQLGQIRIDESGKEIEKFNNYIL